MPDRAAEIAAFLAGNGWRGAERRQLTGDASFRRYERVFADGRRAVLMDAPPEHEDVRPFLAIARYLLARGYSAPAVLAADEAAGLLLLEDLGDDLYTGVLDAGGDEEPLYAAAVDLLVDLHRESPRGLDVPPYDDGRLHREVNLLIDWFLPEITGEPTPKAVRAAFTAAWREVFPLVRAVPEALVLFDYHAPNLRWLPQRAGLKRVGLLDFQDAVIGPVAYDLVSLLEDTRRDVAQATAAATIERYLAGRPEIDRDAFSTAYAVLGAQRNVRIVGTFTRLWRRDGKTHYLEHLPRVWRYIAHDLAHPALAPVRRWLDEHVAAARRGRLR